MITTPYPAQAKSPHIERIILSDADENLVVYFRLVDAFMSEEINQVIQAGLKTVFTYKAELGMVRAVLPAQTLAKVALKRSISHDPLSGRYTVETEGPGGTTRTTTTNLTLAQHLMTEVSDLEITPMAELKKGETYRVRLRAIIHKPEIPKNFKYKIILAPRDVRTDWYEIKIEP